MTASISILASTQASEPVSIAEADEPRFQVTLTGLEVYGNPTFEQWLDKGEDLWYSKQAIQWAIGDWLNFGEKAYGQKYTQAVDETRYTLQSLQNIAYTCAAILPEQRRSNVRFSNHAEVASLPETEREYALDMLQSKQWNRDKVREYKRELKGKTPLTEQTITLRATDIVYKADKVIVVFDKPIGDIIEFKAVISIPKPAPVVSEKAVA